MACSEKIKQYKIIIDECSNNKFPTKELLKTKLDINDKGVSVKTVERRMADLNWEFGISIKFNRVRKGYYVDSNSLDENKVYHKLISQWYISDVLLKNKGTEFVELDDEDTYTGLKHLGVLMTVIVKKSEISFEYKKMGGELEIIKARPLLLKEFENRWYISLDKISDKYNKTEKVSVNTEKFRRNYALDRMTNISIVNSNFEIVSNYNPREYYNHTIGITVNKDIPQIIILEVPIEKSILLNSLPIHRSQHEIFRDKKSVRFQLFVRMNQELINRILKYIDFIKIIEPSKLNNDIKNILLLAVSKM